jgi:hypothetical protein
VSALWVVKIFDIIEHVASSRFPCRINLSLDPLSLEELKETLSNGVIMTANTPTHAVHQVIGFLKALPISAAKLASLIRMHHHSPLWFASGSQATPQLTADTGQ